MGIGDRDDRGRRPLRWDERSGELRFEETPAPRPERLPWLLLAAAVLAVVAAVGWASWRGGGDRSSAGSAGVAPVVVPEVAPPSPELAGPGDSAEWAPEGPVLAGRVLRIVDGDTLDVMLDSGKIRVRMDSIDAPEHDQPGGAASKQALAALVDGADVELEPNGQETYGRMVAVVYRGDRNINAAMVEAGEAWVLREYARDARYCEAEIAARAARLGVWALPPDRQIAPWEWRAVRRGRRDGYSDYSGETLERCVAALGQRGDAVGRPSFAGAAPEPQSEAAPDGCRIKGNIGSRGKVYHLPGSAAYARTKIDPEKGERWFCSEAEARAAGWRAAGG